MTQRKSTDVNRAAESSSSTAKGRSPTAYELVDEIDGMLKGWKRAERERLAKQEQERLAKQKKR